MMTWRNNKLMTSRVFLYCWCCLCLTACLHSTVNGRYVAEGETSTKWSGIRYVRGLRRRDESGIVFPPGKPDPPACNSTSTCVTLAACAIAQKNPSDFKICGWEGVMPSVCCPAAEVSTGSTPVPIRSKDPVPVKECAQQGLSLDVRFRMSRSAMPNGRHLGFAVSPDFNQQEATGTFHPLVIGGTTVSEIEKWPFMAGIYLKMKPSNIFVCGGSLIAKNTILTAAHCFGSRQPDDVYVIRLGEVHLNQVGGVIGRTEFDTSRVVIHPDYHPPLFYNDIALVKIDGVPEFADALRPTCLASVGDETGAVDTAHVIGWGAKQTGGSLSSDLQEAALDIVNNTECNKTYVGLPGSNVSFRNGITSEILCAGNVGKPKDACQGDSGGPLVKVDSDFVIRQIGIVAGGFQCGEPGIPGIYTRVSHYRDWIASNID